MNCRHPASWGCAAIWLISLLFFCPYAGAEVSAPECNGKFKGKKLTQDQLREVVRAHAEWLHDVNLVKWMLQRWESDTYEGVPRPAEDPRRANLCGADLDQADLKGVDLTAAELKSASLRNAKLQEANLSLAYLDNADLSDAKLWKAHLSNASFWKANLHNAYLVYADLSYSMLNDADLSGTAPGDLSNTSMWRTKLTDASLFGTDMTGASILVKYPNDIGGIRVWAHADNLSKLDLYPDTATLIAFSQLREQFKNAGMRQEERSITAALRRSIKKGSGFFNRSFEYVAFELTSDYGASPGRPLLLLILGVFVFAIPYSFVLHHKTFDGSAAIWRVWPHQSPHFR